MSAAGARAFLGELLSGEGSGGAWLRELERRRGGDDASDEQNWLESDDLVLQKMLKPLRVHVFICTLLRCGILEEAMECVRSYVGDAGGEKSTPAKSGERKAKYSDLMEKHIELWESSSRVRMKLISMRKAGCDINEFYDGAITRCRSIAAQSGLSLTSPLTSPRNGGPHLTPRGEGNIGADSVRPNTPVAKPDELPKRPAQNSKPRLWVDVGLPANKPVLSSTRCRARDEWRSFVREQRGKLTSPKPCRPDRSPHQDDASSSSSSVFVGARSAISAVQNACDDWRAPRAFTFELVPLKKKDEGGAERNGMKHKHRLPTPARRRRRPVVSGHPAKVSYRFPTRINMPCGKKLEFRISDLPFLSDALAASPHLQKATPKVVFKQLRPREMLYRAGDIAHGLSYLIDGSLSSYITRSRFVSHAKYPLPANDAFKSQKHKTRTSKGRDPFPRQTTYEQHDILHFKTIEANSLFGFESLFAAGASEGNLKQMHTVQANTSSLVAYISAERFLTLSRNQHEAVAAYAMKRLTRDALLSSDLLRKCLDENELDSKQATTAASGGKARRLGDTETETKTETEMTSSERKVSRESFTPLFRKGESQAEALTALCALRRFTKGMKIQTQGKECKLFYIIVQGTVSIGVSKLNVTMGRGKHFGHSAMLTDGCKARVDIEVTSDELIVMVFAQKEFRILMDVLPKAKSWFQQELELSGLATTIDQMVHGFDKCTDSGDTAFSQTPAKVATV